MQAGVFEGTARYRVERRLGSGGFGDVYAAFDRERGERIAQMVIKEVIRAEIELTDSLDDTLRSVGGFGHTGR